VDFPIGLLMDPDACYQALLDWLHPDGLACPRCQNQDQLRVHRRHRAPILDYRCGACKKVFNLFTDTALKGSKRPVIQIVLILRGFAQGVPTAQLARELECDRTELHFLRHRLQKAAFLNRDRMPLDDPVIEADEMYQNAGEKGVSHVEVDDPPRRRANKRRGHGTSMNDRPPVCGVVGRESGQVRLSVVDRSDGATLRRVVRKASWPGTMVHSDEWGGYNGLRAMGRGHATVCHAKGEWARDDDGDGVREVHDNTMEGFWTGLRNFLRPFRGVSKKYLYQYAAMFEWGYNVKQATLGFMRALLGVESATKCPT